MFVTHSKETVNLKLYDFFRSTIKEVELENDPCQLDTQFQLFFWDCFVLFVCSL